MVEIVENYRGWEPPLDVEAVVQRLLSRLPEHYLYGLRSVVLTYAGGMSRERRRKKTGSRRKKVAIVRCRGLYHPKWRNEPAWIELFVDNILPGGSGPWVRLVPAQDFIIGDVLFHELGHHLHYTQAREHRETEAVAEDWEIRLLQKYVLRRYWHWLPFILVLWSFLWIRRGLRRIWPS